MAELRWILLFLGVVVVGTVYLLSRRNSSRLDDGPEFDGVRREPVIDRQDLPAVEDGDDESATPIVSELPAISSDSEAEVDDAALGQVESSFELVEPEKIVTLRVAFSAAHKLPGQTLIDLFRNFGLRYGRFKIFHKFSSEKATTGSPVFSVASITEPGSFDLANIDEQKIPGLTLFMVLPGAVEGRLAFESMLDLARAAADQFEGEVLDDAGITLSIQRAGYIRDEIIDYERKRSIKARH